MSEEPEFRLQLDHEIKSYENLWTTAAAEQISIRSEKAPVLYSLVKTLLLNWRAISYGAAMPTQFVFVGKAVLDGFVDDSGGNTALLDLATGVLNKLKERVPEIVDHPALANRMLQETVKIGAEFQEWRDSAKIEYPVEKAWRDYLAEPQFSMYIWSSERLCYQGVYNTFEDFLVQCVRTVLGVPPQERLRATDEKFKQGFLNNFGNDAWQLCWTDKDVNAIRLIRIALTHASGRITEDIRKANIDIEEVDGVIQILPYRIRDQYKLLAPRVLQVIDKAVTMPSFA